VTDQLIDGDTFVFLHAHPDDEAIFTGGTIALLSASGARVVVVFATSGELGLGAGPGLGDTRRTEARDACAVLGVERVVFLDHHDTGLAVDRRDQPWGAFAGVTVEAAAEQLADILREEGASGLVTYDAGGVYGHPDHVQAHAVGGEAAARAGLGTWYEVTVDREYLHFVDAHVAAMAGGSAAGLSGADAVGATSVEISTMIDVRPVLASKLGAIAAHRSQVPDDPTFGSGDGFADVYGYEWFIRHGTPTALDALAPAARVGASQSVAGAPGRG